MDSVHQESWTGQMHHGSKKGSNTLTQGSSQQSQSKTKSQRGRRTETMKDEPSSSAESDSSDQGEAVNRLGRDTSNTI